MNVRGGVYSALDGGVGGDGQLFGHWNSFFFSRCWLIKWGWRWRWGRKGEEGEGGGGMMVKATRWPAEMLGASPVKASAASSNAVAVLLFSPLLIPLFGFWHFNRKEGGEGGGGGGGGGRECWNRLLLLFFPRTWRFVGQVAGLNLALGMTSPSHVMRWHARVARISRSGVVLSRDVISNRGRSRLVGGVVAVVTSPSPRPLRQVTWHGRGDKMAPADAMAREIDRIAMGRSWRRFCCCCCCWRRRCCCCCCCCCWRRKLNCC